MAPKGSPRRKGPELNPDAIRRQLLAIVESKSFSRAAYLEKLLRYCVEQTLEGRGCELKEIWLGLNVFDRGHSFEPRKDPIVRVQTRRLREKLEIYYATEGRMADIRITFPVGTYVPLFSTIDPKRWAALPDGRPTALAVLPIDPLDGDERLAKSANMLTAELTHALAQSGAESGNVDIVSRTSVQSYNGIIRDVRTLGRLLNADFLVEGTVRNEKERHHISLELTSVATGYHCWAGWFEYQAQRFSPDVRRIASVLTHELGGMNSADLGA